MTRTLTGHAGNVVVTSAALYVWNCDDCGVLMGVDNAWLEARRKDAGTIYCPNGHKLSYSKSEADIQRERAEVAEAAAKAQRNRAQQAEEAARYQRRRVAALRGHLTRMRNRIAAGVCPVPGCQRTGLTQTLRHIQSQHPDWLHEHPEVTE